MTIFGSDNISEVLLEEHHKAQKREKMTVTANEKAGWEEAEEGQPAYQSRIFLSNFEQYLVNICFLHFLFSNEIFLKLTFFTQKIYLVKNLSSSRFYENLHVVCDVHDK